MCWDVLKEERGQHIHHISSHLALGIWNFPDHCHLRNRRAHTQVVALGWALGGRRQDATAKEAREDKRTKVARLFRNLHERIEAICDSGFRLSCLSCRLSFAVAQGGCICGRLSSSANLGIGTSIPKTWCFLSCPRPRSGKGLFGLLGMS